MILCYLLAIAALNLGLGFLAAVYLRQRYEDTTNVSLPLLVSLAASQAGEGFCEGPGRPTA
jgi:hypothetical protein